MPALIGYLVTLVVFLGGGYAGMQWLTAPEDMPSAIAVHRSIEPVKSTRARLLARKKHEAAAEREASAAPPTVPSASDEAAAPVAESAIKSAPAEVVRLSPLPEVAAVPPAKPVPSEIPPPAKVAAIDIRKEMIPADVSAKANMALNSLAFATAEITVPAPGQPMTEKVAELKPEEKKAVRSILAGADAHATDSKRAASKRGAVTRLASRKPVMMILRTIEFPDGRREQRLLPMPRYRQAFADD